MIRKKRLNLERQNKPQLPVDDGRTIADMDVDGMPWMSKPAGLDLRRRKKRVTEQPEEQRDYFESPLTQRETRRIMASSVIAALIIGLVFIVIIGLFILFAVKVWLR
ncbi:MAG: hypothetical protein GXY22_06530 [Clostridiaceae bacterium]|nr:hypothetical protein [Clostridiaceae bacterium]